MRNSPFLKGNSARLSLRAGSIERSHFWPCVASLCVVGLAAAVAQAAISTTGNVVPTYPGFVDPWALGGPLTIADTAIGNMTVSGGSNVLNTNGDIGDSSNATGTVIVGGTGSSWINSGWLDVGISGTGMLTGQDGGSVSCAVSALGVHDNSTGIVTVDNSSWTNSGWVDIGYEGSGTLNVQNGGSVINTNAYLGRNTDATGTSTVTGIGSTWENTGDLSLGSATDSGFGDLTISNSGTVYVGDAASSSGSLGWLTISDFDSGGTSGGHLYVYNGSTLAHNYAAVVGKETGEYGWATVDGFGSSWTNSSILVIGYFGSGTLTIQNGGSVTNLSGEIGISGSGTVTVDGDGSSWTNSELLSVGGLGSGTLTIQNGGDVSNNVGFIGHTFGDSGTVTVTGSGSTWENTEDLLLGYWISSGVGSLTISDSGTVYVGDAASSSGTAGYLTVSDADDSGSDGGHLAIYNGSTLIHNSAAVVGNEIGEYGWATVDGADSSWTNRGKLYIGNSGSGTLTVQNGGSVSSTYSWIASSAGGSGTVTVDGMGSSWSNSGTLYVGRSDSGTLTVQNNGSVSNTDGWIGCYAGGSGTVTVTGSGSTWENTGDLQLGYPTNTGVGSLAISDSGTVYVGDAASSGGTAGYLTVSDADASGLTGGHLELYNSSTLIHSNVAVVGDHVGEYGWATVDGTSTSWTNSGILCVGYRGGSGTLNVQNGGSVSSSAGWIAAATVAAGTVSVDGADSSWTNSGGLYVGYFGSGTLTVQNAGNVSNTEGWIGYVGGATGTVTITGSGSTWENTEDLSLGNSSNSGVGDLTISDGGTAWVGDAASSGGTAGWLTVSDSDASGTSGGHLYVYHGSTLTHSSSAAVGNESGEFGWATINGTGSSWTNSGLLCMGYRGGSGTLTIQNGGSVSNSLGWLAASTFSTGAVTVDGSGSSWINSGELYVGYFGSGTLTVQNGGSVSDTTGWIGYAGGATGTATVDGSDSTWENTGDLSLGRSYSSGVGSLTISGSGTVYVGDAAMSGGTAGWLTVSDADGSGTAGGHLYVYHGSTLSHGGYAMVGNDPGEFGWATVDGAGSSWINDGSLFVGGSGSGTLTIQNGGSVSSPSGLLGYYAGGIGTATVDGTGSSWTNSGNLTIGGWNSGALAIQNGGSVSNTNGELGKYSGSTGIVTVDGAGSVWTNSLQLLVGQSGQGTLTITEGGLVSVAGALTIDWDSSGDSFINMATGAMLALFGDADGSLGEFLDLIDGTDAINYWEDLISGWANITLATPGTDYKLDYIDVPGDLQGYTVLTVGSLLPGDFDIDGDVDGADFLEWQREDGSPSGLAAWQSNFGAGSAPLAEAASVPEPSSLLLMALCLSGLAGAHWRCAARRIAFRGGRSSRTDCRAGT